MGEIAVLELLVPAAAASRPLGPPVLQVVLTSLFAVYIGSKVGGEITSRLRLTPILGELLAGIVLGVSLLQVVLLPGSNVTASDSLLLQAIRDFHPGLGEAALAELFETQGLILATLSKLGVILLLFQVGLESDLRELIKVAPQAGIMALLGVGMPLTAGLGGLVGIFGIDLTSALFAAAAMTATSIGISISILTSLRMVGSRAGQVILGAAVLDDITGILILTLVNGLVVGRGLDPAGVLVLLVMPPLFLLAAIALSRLLGSLFVGFSGLLKSRGTLLLLALAFCFGLAFLADAARLEPLIGAFAAGLIVGQTELNQSVERQIQPIADLLIPIFFVVTGAQIDMRTIDPFSPSGGIVLLMGLFLTAIVVAGKLGGAYLVQRLTPDPPSPLPVAFGMLPRGEVTLIVLGIGIASGQMSSQSSAAVVLAVLATVVLTPLGLRQSVAPPQDSH